jgi:hypothetical protein
MTAGPKSSGDTASAPVLLGHPFNHRPPAPPVPTIPTDGYDTRDRQPRANGIRYRRVPQNGVSSCSNSLSPSSN